MNDNEQTPPEVKNNAEAHMLLDAASIATGECVCMDDFPKTYRVADFGGFQIRIS